MDMYRAGNIYGFIIEKNYLIYKSEIFYDARPAAILSLMIILTST